MHIGGDPHKRVYSIKQTWNHSPIPPAGLFSELSSPSEDRHPWELEGTRGECRERAAIRRPPGHFIEVETRWETMARILLMYMRANVRSRRQFAV